MVLGTNVRTLLDIRKTLDPDGKPAHIIEALQQSNPMLDDMMFREGNLDVGHQTTIRTGLPTVYWALINQPIPASKSSNAQVVETCGMMVAWSKIAVDLADLPPGPAANRLSEGVAFLEAMSQEHQQTLIYGNSSVSPEEFNGLAVRYSSLSAVNAQNIVDAGGTGSDNTSIWIVAWGEKSVHGIYPKGSKAGVDHKDFGIVVETSSDGEIDLYKDKWMWKTGLVLKDWRYVVRICNIDVSNLVGESSAADLIKVLTKAVYRVGGVLGAAGTRPVIYMNRTVAEFLDIQAQAKVNTGGGITFDNVDGQERNRFRGWPIKIVDQLLETESRVV
jgi:hypothetical protein